ncbi:hypothetical protein T552_03538 [Pneumocystis carinii B80]|uniref:Conserved oligomeric Golgi complex subunit 7 n=1 Tax=Pneumocystis carinii (strain B80) TaxID=1408658 RepID=A0A0W4ZBG8_PNEC8|nr:hypothetical protein T552_03538 [Pneumocystis carinii B80]KTW25677.1 hypothetical protein T552_03538 [Pneumocystis carinii B80]
MQTDTNKTIPSLSSLLHLPSAYINSFLSSSISLEEAHNITTNLLSSLETESRSTIDQLQEITNEIIQELPQLNHDIELLNKNIVVLLGILNKKKEYTESFKKGVENHVIDNFMHLDLIKQRIEATQIILKEAKEWKNIETKKKHIELLIKNKEIEEAQNVINKLKRLVEVWKETNEYKERVDMIKILEQKISDFTEKT